MMDSSPSRRDVAAAVEFVTSALAANADPNKAAGLQAYMKTDMPFYGAQKPGRARILSHLVREFPPDDRNDYEDQVAALWELPHREEKYLAQGIAVSFPDFIVPESLPLYERFIVERAWWDFVDETATHLIRESDSREDLSGLSYREATEHIGHLVSS